jgi:hypothetical protein
MENTLLAIIAVAGTLLGSVVAYLFQRKSSAQAEVFAHQQQLRAERMTAYSYFAGAISEGLRGELNRWHRAEGNPDSPEALDARLESYRLRSISLHAMYRVQLVAADQALRGTVRDIYERMTLIHKADSEAELDMGIEEARGKLAGFMILAAQDIQSMSNVVTN